MTYNYALDLLYNRSPCLFIVLGNIELNEIRKKKYLVTAYAAQRPREGFSHPHQEHMKDTYMVGITML